ncbi:MAG: hypothetical protein U0528_16560 [Anaerolineae bacterium]
MTPQRRIVWLFAIVLCVILFFQINGYLRLYEDRAGAATPVMPLDDAYIHFQYARAIAEGHPFRYNADQPPSSGATSLLYPFLLALGYKLGFTGLLLGWWALGIGVVSWIAATLLLYLMLARHDRRIALLLAGAFLFTGSLSWAFMSGMETGLLIAAIFLTLYCVIAERHRAALIAAVVTALIRPEGLPIAVLTVGYVVGKVALTPQPPLPQADRGGVHSTPFSRLRERGLGEGVLYLLPILSGLVQPILNYAITGSISASGLQAKSYLYNVPFDLGTAISQIVSTFARSWAHLIWNSDQSMTAYSFLLLPIGLIGLVASLRQRKITSSLLIIGWMLAITGMAATLETAFWQMERYQQPAVALLYPLAGLALPRYAKQMWLRYAVYLICGVIVLQAASSEIKFRDYYAENVREVASSQIPMAQWTAANVPADAVIGVHDIGVMRYLGTHTTYDVVGLTTAGAARAWRSGPGATYEFMAKSTLRPDYFAIYPDARGLTYFQDTGLFREKLAEFPSVYPDPHNVASATWLGQNVYKADWTYAQYADQPHQPYSLEAIKGMTLIDSVNVGDLEDEDAHHYRWAASDAPGFATEVREMDYVSCQPVQDNPSCRVMDGGRTLRDEEMFITVTPGQDVLWIMRVHPYQEQPLDFQLIPYDYNSFTLLEPLGVFEWLPSRIIPQQAGQWIEVAILIPHNLVDRFAKLTDGNQYKLRIRSYALQGTYQPYYHWFYSGNYQANAVTPQNPAIFGVRQTKIQLSQHSLVYDAVTKRLTLTATWEALQSSGTAPFADSKLFIHLYDEQGKLVELPGAQFDRRPGDGAVPLVNLLPGAFTESYTLDLSNVPAGTYRVAMGLYQPTGTMERLPVEGDGADQDRRLFIGTIEVK